MKVLLLLLSNQSRGRGDYLKSPEIMGLPWLNLSRDLA